MKIKVLLFGILAEEAGKDEIVAGPVSNLNELKDIVLKQYPSFNKYKFNISVNHMILHTNTDLKEGDEVAFLPPFAGG